MKEVRRIEPLSRPFDAVVEVPGSKSVANRLIVLACLGAGPTEIRGATLCDDVRLLVEGVRALGHAAEILDADRGRLRIGPGPAVEGASARIDCGAGGTTLRFLLTLAALRPGRWTLGGVPRLMARPMTPLLEALRDLGSRVEHDPARSEIRIEGGRLRGGRCRLDAGISSQFASSLLLGAGAMPEGLVLELEGKTASSGYLELTREALLRFGITVEVSARGDLWVVAPEASARAPERPLEVEGDWSAAGPLLALAAVTGSRIRFPNLDPGSSQPDRQLPAAIERLGASGALELDCGAMPDQLMTLAFLGTRREDSTRLGGAANLRGKECDRLAVLTRELGAAGAAIREEPEGVVLGPGAPVLSPRRFDPEGDHRMAMLFGILGAVLPGVEIEDPGCVSKSWPAFFDDLDRLRAAAMPWALVGLRGAGKSTVGAALAALTGEVFLDLDRVFEERHGPIGDLVAREGWPRFREIEEGLAAEFLPGAGVLALGGGAVESARTRALIRESAVGVWLHAPLPLLAERIRGSDRPSLTGAPPEEELADLLERRTPLYADCARLLIDGRDSPEAVAAAVVSATRSLVVRDAGPATDPPSTAA